MELHPYLSRLRKAVKAEDREQEIRYTASDASSVKAQRNSGLVLHPVRISGRSYGYLDYPEIAFRLPFPQDTSLFRSGVPVACFAEGEESIRGLLLDFDGKQGEFRLHASEVPDWLEDGQTGLRLLPDRKTHEVMLQALERLPEDRALYQRFLATIGEAEIPKTEAKRSIPTFLNATLNESQQAAVSGILSEEPFTIVHGPPGTGKTTTLVEAVRQLVGTGKKVIVSASGNAAVDHFTRELIRYKVSVLRLGNSVKTDEAVLPHTPEGKLSGSSYQKEIRKLRLRAEELRKMALQYKRRFGKEEREQRRLLLREVKSIRNEIRELQEYAEDKFLEEAQVILGTPIGLQTLYSRQQRYDALFIDEAGQCTEPLAWTIIPLATKIVLAGDHHQLPPTVLSEEAQKLGLRISVPEQWIKHIPQVFLLNTQYRMPEGIAGFSNNWFYEGKLHSHSSGEGQITFIDTAGSEAVEKSGEEGASLENEAEANLITQLIASEGLLPENTIVISPYSGQVALLKEKLDRAFRISTIDSFQGQECDHIIISLVRSNDTGKIGFLSDYRRMNVAITRARKKLFVAGDSTTIGTDAFFNAFLEYVEKNGAYRSIWEFAL